MFTPLQWYVNYNGYSLPHLLLGTPTTISVKKIGFDCSHVNAKENCSKIWIEGLLTVYTQFQITQFGEDTQWW